MKDSIREAMISKKQMCQPKVKRPLGVPIGTFGYFLNTHKSILWKGCQQCPHTVYSHHRGFGKLYQLSDHVLTLFHLQLTWSPFILPFSIRNLTNRTPSSPCPSRTTASYTRRLRRRQISSNSTNTFDEPDPIVRKDAARPAGVGLSAEERIPSISFNADMGVGFSLDGYASPATISSSSERCVEMLATEVGSVSFQVSIIKLNNEKKYLNEDRWRKAASLL